jgi:hypothetical protein
MELLTIDTKKALQLISNYDNVSSTAKYLIKGMKLVCVFFVQCETNKIEKTETFNWTDLHDEPSDDRWKQAIIRTQEGNCIPVEILFNLLSPINRAIMTGIQLCFPK